MLRGREPEPRRRDLFSRGLVVDSSVSQSLRPPVDHGVGLTLDVDGHRGVLPVGRRLVGGPAGDELTRLDVAGRQVQRAHRALSAAVPQQGLRTEER